MCSIAGIVDLVDKENVQKQLLEKMGVCMRHRGPDQEGVYLKEGVGLQHNRLAIIDVLHGLQPMTRRDNRGSYTIVYNGELYNTPELTEKVKKRGIELETYCDTEVVLAMYRIYKEKCVDYLNGIFAFAVWDDAAQSLYVARDRFGVKPFFYSQKGTTFLFASEVKALLAHPSIKPVVDREGIWQLIYMAPTKIEGTSVFKDIHEIPAGYHGFYNQAGLHLESYFEMKAIPFRQTEEEAYEQTRELVTDAIERQLVSDVPLATLLSGGLDSSIITSVAARRYQQEGKKLATYSFEYEENKKYFKPTLFQPQSDDEFARHLAEILGTEHHILTASIEVLINGLKTAAYYRDLPGMADIDSSLLYYCEEIKKEHTVVLSGECADEIFGGYPWFYRPEMLESGYFPWIHQATERASLFDAKRLKIEEGYEFAKDIYRQSVAKCPVLEEDSASMRQSRIATWLSVHYFMTSLLERKDRMSMASGVEVRVPFADHRILQYVYNVPWEIKFKGAVEKSLLREAMKDFLPEIFIKRKKSPYPKTHHPLYEQYVVQELKRLLSQKTCRLTEIIDKRAIGQLLEEQNVTWFGQLMSKPQLLAWLIQLEDWLESYEIELQL